MKKIVFIALTTFLASCTTQDNLEINQPQIVEKIEYTNNPPENGRIVVGVYSYDDLTGQRKPSDNSTLSTAVTQGAENFLIDGLKEYSNGGWFRVVERKNIDNIIRERQIIRSTRETIDQELTDISPMLYAGILVEGGIIGYDSNVRSGGAGLRVFGAGVSEKYTSHKVTVALRVVSVATSEIIISVIIEKEVLSSTTNTNAIKFFDVQREVLEIEAGMKENEAPSRAVKIAINKAIHELVNKGIEENIW